MSTILFNEIVFGPIKSRRLGISLGVNLLPLHGKWCNFDCVYCECGFNKDGVQDRVLPTKQQVMQALESKLANHVSTIGKIDTVTFSGNGEPTLHPDFHEIIFKTLELRDLYAKEAKVSVLTNGSRIGDPKVAEALLKVDNAIIKIDSAFEESVKLIDRPLFNYSTDKIVKELELFRGKFVLQTMFLRGNTPDGVIDNTVKEEVEAWYNLVLKTGPREVMIYTIDRETPVTDLQKVLVGELELIALPLRARGYKVTVSG
ncbi:MAG: radical SAM protein [Bacteroidales bacterium]|nr:radical SAM protein [Bacteroidales bacterium]